MPPSCSSIPVMVRSRLRERQLSIAAASASTTDGVGDFRLPRRVGGQIEAAPRAVTEVHEAPVATAPHCQVLPFQPAVPWPLVVAVGDEGVAPIPLVVGRVAPHVGPLAASERRQWEAVALRRQRRCPSPRTTSA